MCLVLLDGMLECEICLTVYLSRCIYAVQIITLGKLYLQQHIDHTQSFHNVTPKTGQLTYASTYYIRM